jgi:TorA maturation chaperone TorD
MFDQRHEGMCARTCAALRKFLRTWLQTLTGRAISSTSGPFYKKGAQLLAQQGFAPSLKDMWHSVQRIDGPGGP